MTRYVQNPETAYQVFEGQAVLLAPRSSEIYRLNQTATTLWEALKAPLEPRELIAALVAGFEVGEDRARRDVEAFLREFVDRQLIREEVG